MALPFVLSPITKWAIGIGLLVVLYFASVKVYDMSLDWLNQQKKEAVDAALSTQAANISASSANAQLSNIQQQLEDQKRSQGEMLRQFSIARGDMQRLERLQKEQNLASVLQTNPEQGVALVNMNTANAWLEFDAVNKELSHEK